MANKAPIYLAFATALALVGAGGWWMTRTDDGDRFASCRQGVVAGGLDMLGGPFTLTDENGQRVTDKDVFTKPSLLYFGYSFCPDVCPLDSARNASAADLLTERGYDAQTVFITVDPKRDTPDVLREFTDYLHPDMLGLTGTTEEIAAVNKSWRNYFKLNDEEDPEYYLVDHTTNTFLVLPEYGTVEFFRRDLSPEDMAARVGCFVDKM